MAEVLFDMESSQATKRGRRPFPTDATLCGWRNSFVWPLEHAWGQIGCELRQATTTAHIRDAFSRLADQRSEFRLFSTPYSTVVKTKQQRRDRISRGELIDQERHAREVEDQCRTSLNVALSALRVAEGTDQERAMLHEREIRTKALKQAEQHRIEVEEQQRRLSAQIVDQEAGFAQTELLDFILGGRYELTPVNFANAMAGLPFIAWRQSFKRCLRWPCPFGVVYGEFKLIAAACRASAGKSGSLVERIRLYLQRKKVDKETKEPVAQLKQKWYYLAKAAEQIEKQQHPSDAVPFKLMAEYQRLYNAQTAVDKILAEEAQLW